MNHFCSQASRLASDAFERPLRFSERIKLKLHCWMCASCRHYASSLFMLHDTFKGIRKHENNTAHLTEARKKEIMAYCQKNMGDKGG